MMALNLDTFTLFIVLTLTYGLHNSAKCFSHYQHNIIFFQENWYTWNMMTLRSKKHTFLEMVGNQFCISKGRDNFVKKKTKKIIAHHGCQSHVYKVSTLHTVGRISLVQSENVLINP